LERHQRDIEQKMGQSNMIRHIVVFNVKNNIDQTQIDEALSAIASLKNELPGIKEIHCGACHYIEEANPTTRYTHGFSIDFIDETARNNFLNNALSIPAKEKILAITERGYKGLGGFEIIS